MNLHEIPYKVVISMPQCSDRRWKLHETLCGFGIMDLDCLNPVPVTDIDPYEYPHLSPSAYPYISQILTIRHAISEAKRHGAKSMWLLEDDAQFHPQFFNRVRRLRVPNNWRFLYLGGAFYTNAVRINEALIKPEHVLDLHSVVISSEIYEILDRTLGDALQDWNMVEPFADVIFASLHKQHPAYLCRPNLVWQSEHYSDLKNRTYSNYRHDGEQWHLPNELPTSAIYTLWTKENVVLRDWPDEETLVDSFMQSARAAAEHFPRVVLYTDTRGKKLLEDVSFDDVYVTLDSLDVDPRIRVAAKLDTMTRQTERFVHIEPYTFFRDYLDACEEQAIIGSVSVQAKELADAVSWLKGVDWKPAFVNKVIESGKVTNSCFDGILGGKDVEFFKWYGELALEILRKPENVAYIRNSVDVASLIICDALGKWLLGACALCRGKDFHYFGDPQQNGHTFIEQLSSNEDQAHSFTDKLRDDNRKALPLIKSSTKYVRYAKHGHGWYVNLHGIDHHVIVDPRRTFENGCQDGALTPFGITYTRHILAEKEEATPLSPEETARVLENLRRLVVSDICVHARQRTIEQFAIFQGEVQFHSNFFELLNRIKIPYDWQFIYLAGTNNGTEEYVSRGLIKSDCIRGLEAVIVRSEAASELISILSAPLAFEESACDRISQLHKTLPAYLCAPRLAFI